jgi:hypothetical protein
MTDIDSSVTSSYVRNMTLNHNIGFGFTIGVAKSQLTVMTPVEKSRVKN